MESWDVEGKALAYCHCLEKAGNRHLASVAVLSVLMRFFLT